MKEIIIMRGLPGSGKSFTARTFGYPILSTDDFWGVDYNFDSSKLAEAHEWNYSRALALIEKGESLVIDNTNVMAWEAKKYVVAAIEKGYNVRIIEPSSRWWRDFTQANNKSEWALFFSIKNTHKVPKEVIAKMIKKWHWDLTVEDILNA